MCEFRIARKRLLLHVCDTVVVFLFVCVCTARVPTLCDAHTDERRNLLCFGGQSINISLRELVYVQCAHNLRLRVCVCAHVQQVIQSGIGESIEQRVRLR